MSETPDQGMTESEAKKILLGVKDEDWGPIHHAAHGFLAGRASMQSELASVRQLKDSWAKSAAALSVRLHEAEIALSKTKSARNTKRGKGKKA